MADADVYRVKVRFEKLFADPRVFDEPQTLAPRYLASAGLPPEKAAYIYQTTDDVAPVNDAGAPSVAAGFARYRYEGKTVRSEYMVSANITVEYVDFGSGLSPQDHRKLWSSGRWDEIRFETREFNHRRAETGMPEITDLYSMLKARANPNTLVAVELTEVGKDLFRATVAYLGNRLKSLGTQDGATVEVYSAKELALDERKALEKRLARESSDSTLYVILSKDTVGVK